MNSPGWKLRQVRERLNLTYRDVEEATSAISAAKMNTEYQLAVSRLADIENKGLVPNVYRLYSLCVTYRLNFVETLRWYGIDLRECEKDSQLYAISKTHMLPDAADDTQEIRLPVRLDPGLNLRQTNYLSRMIQSWGSVPLCLLRQLDVRHHRYGRIGHDDWMMYPLITPGALVQIDTQRRRIEPTAWRNDFERPVYFVETREGYVCSWVMALDEGQLLLQPYSLSPCKASVKAMPDEAEIVGQVIGVAMKLGLANGDKTRLPAGPG